MLCADCDWKKAIVSIAVTTKTNQSDMPSQRMTLRYSLRQLEIFVATAREGSTRAAAERVARSQSAASAALGDLEAALGVKLFDRVGRGMRLNESGRTLLPRARALLDQASELQALFGIDKAAPLRVAASFTIGEHLLPAMISQWTLTHPHGLVQLHIGNTRDVIETVAGFDADLGFIEGPQTHPDLIVRPWLEDELVIIAAPGHPLARRVASVRQLADATWALREYGSGTRQVTDAWLMQHLPEIRAGYEMGSTEAIKHIVAAGTALGCLSRHAVAQALEDRHLVVLRTQLPPARRRLALVVHRNKRLGATAAAFVQHCGAEPPES